MWYVTGLDVPRHELEEAERAPAPARLRDVTRRSRARMPAGSTWPHHRAASQLIYLNRLHYTNDIVIYMRNNTTLKMHNQRNTHELNQIINYIVMM